MTIDVEEQDDELNENSYEDFAQSISQTISGVEPKFEKRATGVVTISLLVVVALASTQLALDMLEQKWNPISDLLTAQSISDLNIIGFLKIIIVFLTAATAVGSPQLVRHYHRKEVHQYNQVFRTIERKIIEKQPVLSEEDTRAIQQIEEGVDAIEKAMDNISKKTRRSVRESIRDLIDRKLKNSTMIDRSLIAEVRVLLNESWAEKKSALERELNEVRDEGIRVNKKLTEANALLQEYMALNKKAEAYVKKSEPQNQSFTSDASGLLATP